MAFPVSEMDRTSRIGAGNAGVALFIGRNMEVKMEMICQCRLGKLKKGRSSRWPMKDLFKELLNILTE